MRRPAYQKTSPRTLALPGFVVSGISKMPGSMGSAVSFERVQMSPYRHSPPGVFHTGSFGTSRSNAGGAQCESSFSRIGHREPVSTVPLHLNAFKRQVSAAMPPLRTPPARPIVFEASPSTNAKGSALLPDHALRRPSRQRWVPTSCRGMERSSGRRICRLMIGAPGVRRLQTSRPQPAAARELMPASEPLLELWNLDLLVAVEAPSSTLRLRTAYCFASQSAIAVCRGLRTPISVRQTGSSDLGRDAVTSSRTSTALCATPDLDTLSGSVKAPLQFVLQRACSATEIRGHRTRVVRTRLWAGRSDRSRSPPSDDGLLPLSEWIPRGTSDCRPRPCCARTIAASWVICLRKAAAPEAPIPSAREHHRPYQLTHQGARPRGPTPSFERVQMRARPYPIHPAGRTPAPAETFGHLVTGATPMHRLK